jgi:hypothetical protein
MVQPTAGAGNKGVEGLSERGPFVSSLTPLTLDAGSSAGSGDNIKTPLRRSHGTRPIAASGMPSRFILFFPLIHLTTILNAREMGRKNCIHNIGLDR